MARILDQVVGHQNLIHNLLSAIREDRLHQTLIFAGPDGVGRQMVATGIGQALVCERSREACGACGPCIRIAHKQSESLLMVEAEKQQIKMDQAHRVLEFLRLRSAARARIVIIQNAEYLNTQASNALLKSLEEPPPGTYIVLLAPSHHHVLATIRSRAQTVRFAPLTVEEIRHKSKAPEWALHACQGSFSRLAQLHEREELDIRDQAVNFLEEYLANPNAYLIGAWRDSIRDRGHAVAMLKHVTTLLRDALLYQNGERVNLLNLDQLALVARLAALMPTWLLGVAEGAMTAEKSILANRDTQLVFEELWLSRMCGVQI